jgi:hypothetical protein
MAKQVYYLKRERALLMERMVSLAQLMRGSVFCRFSTCSRPVCSCHQGKKHGPRSYIVIVERGRQRQHYIPNDQVAAARSSVKQYNELLKLVDRVTAINLKLMQQRGL